METMDWIVHTKGGPDQSSWEIAVVRASDAHGQASYGWFGATKMLIGSSGGPSRTAVPEMVWSRLMRVAEEVAAEMNGGEVTGDPHDHGRSMPIIPDRVEHAPAPEQRWHEIATEGLPPAPDGTWFLIYCPAREPEVQQAQLRDGGVWDLMDREYSEPAYARDATHWHPLPEPPAPPTSNDTHCARCGALVYHVEHARQNPLSVTYWLDDRRLCPDCGKAAHRAAETGLETRRGDAPPTKAPR